MRFWLLVGGSIFLICGIVMMFSVAFGFALSIFRDGTVAVSIWHLLLPLLPTAVGLAMLLAAPRGDDAS